MTTYNSFSAWLIGKGFDSYLYGDELADGTSQGFFSSQYTAWLGHVVEAYVVEIRSFFGYAADHQISVASINQNDPTGLPVITGLTLAQVDQLFNVTMDFSWFSGGKKPVEHIRYYSNEFCFNGVVDTTPPAAPAVSLDSDTGSSSADLITSDGTLTVVPAEPGGSIEYSTDGGATWSAAFAAAEGANDVLVRQVDAAGNLGAAANIVFTLDNTAPAAPAVSLDSDTGSSSADLITSDGTLTVVPAEPGGSIEYSTDGGATWSAAFAAAEGANDVLVRQVDAAGNLGAAANIVFTLDNTAPAAPAVSLDSDTGSSSADLITSDGTLTVVPAEPGGSIEYSTDGGATWSAAFAAAEGANDVLVRQVDAAGNLGAAANIVFTLDNTAPAAPAVSLDSDTGSSSADLITSDGTLTVVPAEPGGSIEYSTDGGATWSAAFAAAEGANDVLVRQVDAAGNLGAAANIVFTLDNTAPAAPAVSLDSDTGSSSADLITSDGTLTVVPAEPGGSIEYSTDGGATWSAAFAAAEGANDVLVRQVDAAGNLGAAANIVFTLDTIAPSDIRINVSASLIAAVSGSGAGGNNSTGAATTIGTLSAVGADAGSTYAIEGVSAKFEIVNGNELKLKAGQDWGDGDGTLDLTIRVTDSAGNSYYETFTFRAGAAGQTNDFILGIDAGGLGTLGSPTVGDDFIFAFRGNDGLNTNGSTIFGTSGDDALFGGTGADTLYGGAGDDQMYGGDGDDRLIGGSDDDILGGGLGADQFRFIAPALNGLDTVLDFLKGTDKIGLQQTGGGWNAAGTAATANGVTLNVGDYIQTRNGVGNIQASDGNKVVELQTAQTAAEISTGVGAAVNAYVVVFNSTTNRGELWHDTDWSNAGDRTQLATFDDMTTLGQVTNLTNVDFVEWM